MKCLSHCEAIGRLAEEEGTDVFCHRCFKISSAFSPIDLLKIASTYCYPCVLLHVWDDQWPCWCWRCSLPPQSLFITPPPCSENACATPLTVQRTRASAFQASRPHRITQSSMPIKTGINLIVFIFENIESLFSCIFFSQHIYWDTCGPGMCRLYWKYNILRI